MASSLMNQVVEFVTTQTAGPVSTQEVIEHTGVNPSTAKVSLHRGVERGLIRRVGPGQFQVAEPSTNAQLDAEITGAGMRVEGPIALEGVPTGDGRMFEEGALEWEGVLPVALIWDRDEGDHTAMTVGSVDTVERRDGGIIWASAVLSESEDPETQAAVRRVAELLEEGAVGVSIMWDNPEVEVRVRAEEMEEDEPEVVEGEDGEERIIVARMKADDVLFVYTAGRLRHVAIVDTAAFAETGFEPVLAAASLWEDRSELFADPGFTKPGDDDRLRYDPHADRWSCPPTVNRETGSVFGHIAPEGLCLRGQPGRCVTPPKADLQGFMRHHAPAAGGQRTGVICIGGDPGHCNVGVGAAEATKFYDRTGRAVADVRVGYDAFGVWFAGMLRPGVSDEDVYAFEASDVSGHWEFDKRRKPVLCGLPAVNVGGFPKGYLTFEEVQSGLAAAGEIAASCGCNSGEGESCGCGITVTETVTETVEEYTADVMLEDDGVLGDVLASLARIEEAVAPLFAAHLAATVEVVDETV